QKECERRPHLDPRHLGFRVFRFVLDVEWNRGVWFLRRQRFEPDLAVSQPALFKQVQGVDLPERPPNPLPIDVQVCLFLSTAKFERPRQRSILALGAEDIYVPPLVDEAGPLDKANEPK